MLIWDVSYYIYIKIYISEVVSHRVGFYKT